MTKRNVLAGSALALGLTLAASASMAHGIGGFVCQTSSVSKGAAPMTHCITWTHQAGAQMQAAQCDPGKMSPGAMREQCAKLSAQADRAPATAG